MEKSVSPKQTLFLWRLLVEPEGIFLKGLKPELTAAERNQLVALGLIAVDKRKANPKARATNYAILAEKGWNWAATHLDAKLPVAGNAALTVLGKLLGKLKVRIESGELSLADLFSTSAPKPIAASNAIALSVDELKNRLFDACRQITGGGIYGVRIRLADLRTKLAEIPRSTIDSVLLDLEQNKVAALYPFDDPREIRSADEEAALPNSSGTRRHILYLSHPTSANSPNS
jgi:hypothetical protein